MTGEPTIADALELLDRAHATAREAVANAPTPQLALQWADAFFRAAEQMPRKGSDLRAQTAKRVWEDEEFDIAQPDIADAYSVTKQRVSKMIKQAAKGK